MLTVIGEIEGSNGKQPHYNEALKQGVFDYDTINKKYEAAMKSIESSWFKKWKNPRAEYEKRVGFFRDLLKTP